MKRRLIYGTMVLLFLLAGCNRTSISQIDEPTDEVAQSPKVGIHGMTPGYSLPGMTPGYNLPSDSLIHGSVKGSVYKGEIKLQNDLDALPVLDLRKEGYASYYVDGVEYAVLYYSSRFNKSRFASGWVVDLDKLSPIAKTASGEIILAPDCDDSLVMCIYDYLSDELHCLLRRNFDENGICALELDDFDVYVDGRMIPQNEKIRNIWEMHTADNACQKGYPPLDGDWTYYSLRLNYRYCPALQYEMNFALIEGYLYIDNLVSGEMKCIPADQIIRPEHEDM